MKDTGDDSKAACQKKTIATLPEPSSWRQRNLPAEYTREQPSLAPWSTFVLQPLLVTTFTPPPIPRVFRSPFDTGYYRWLITGDTGSV